MSDPVASNEGSPGGGGFVGGPRKDTSGLTNGVHTTNGGSNNNRGAAGESKAILAPVLSSQKPQLPFQSHDFRPRTPIAPDFSQFHISAAIITITTTRSKSKFTQTKTHTPPQKKICFKPVKSLLGGGEPRGCGRRGVTRGRTATPSPPSRTRTETCGPRGDG